MRLRCVCGGIPHGFVFEGNSPEDPCPRCGKSGPMAVAKLVDVHFIVMDEAGPILGAVGRQYVACQRKRDHLALHSYDTFAASDEPVAVTCPSCKGTKEFLAAAAKIPEVAEYERIQSRLRADCCG